ncbi:MAG: hypothetical protein AAGD96_00175 [Chloroflexota bacterium]
METSVKNAGKLAIIGAFQFLPFTFFSIIGFLGIAPPIVWILGMVLFIFYIRHGLGRINNPVTVRRYWISSLVFNGIGLAVPGYLVYLIGYFLIDQIVDFPRGYRYSDDELFLGSLLFIWSALILIHLWFSYVSYDRLNREMDWSNWALIHNTPVQSVQDSA